MNSSRSGNPRDHPLSPGEVFEPPQVDPAKIGRAADLARLAVQADPFHDAERDVPLSAEQPGVIRNWWMPSWARVSAVAVRRPRLHRHHPPVEDVKHVGRSGCNCPPAGPTASPRGHGLLRRAWGKTGERPIVAENDHGQAPVGRCRSKPRSGNAFDSPPRAARSRPA